MSRVEVYPKPLSESSFTDKQIRWIRAEAKDIAHGDRNSSSLTVGGYFFFLEYRRFGWARSLPLVIAGSEMMRDEPVLEFSNGRFLLIPIIGFEAANFSASYVDDAFDLIVAKYRKTADEPEVSVTPVVRPRLKQSLLGRIFGTSVDES